MSGQRLRSLKSTWKWSAFKTLKCFLFKYASPTCLNMLNIVNKPGAYLSRPCSTRLQTSNLLTSDLSNPQLSLTKPGRFHLPADPMVVPKCPMKKGGSPGLGNRNQCMGAKVSNCKVDYRNDFDLVIWCVLWGGSWECSGFNWHVKQVTMVDCFCLGQHLSSSGQGDVGQMNLRWHWWTHNHL